MHSTLLRSVLTACRALEEDTEQAVHRTGQTSFSIISLTAQQAGVLHIRVPYAMLWCGMELSGKLLTTGSSL